MSMPLPASLTTPAVSIVKTFVLLWPKMCRQGAVDLLSSSVSGQGTLSKRAVLVAPSWMTRLTVVRTHPFLWIAVRPSTESMRWGGSTGSPTWR